MNYHCNLPSSKFMPLKDSSASQEFIRHESSSFQIQRLVYPALVSTPGNEYHMTSVSTTDTMNESRGSRKKGTEDKDEQCFSSFMRKRKTKRNQGT